MNDNTEHEVLRRIRPTQRIAASNSFRERVMKTIAEEKQQELLRPVWRWTGWPRWVAIACAATALILFAPQFLPQSPGVALLAQSVQAMANVRGVHITGRIRTLPNDNFDFIGAQYDFVPVEIWREYTDPPRWRVEKPGRVAVMNGQSALLYIRSGNSAVRASTGAGFIGWLRPLLDPKSVLQHELAAAHEGAAQATVAESKGVLTATLRRTARGDFANAWAKNKSIPESDHTCIYRFDSNRRLQGLQVVTSTGGTDVVIAEFTGFAYDEALPQALFTILLPPDVDSFALEQTRESHLFRSQGSRRILLRRTRHRELGCASAGDLGNLGATRDETRVRRPAGDIPRRAFSVRAVPGILRALRGVSPRWLH